MFHSKGIPKSSKDPIRAKHIRMSRAYRPGARNQAPAFRILQKNKAVYSYSLIISRNNSAASASSCVSVNNTNKGGNTWKKRSNEEKKDATALT